MKDLFVDIPYYEVLCDDHRVYNDRNGKKEGSL